MNFYPNDKGFVGMKIL